MLTIYTFDDTKEYKGASVTMLDPEETKRQGKDVWLMPPNATTVKPVMKAGYAPVWDGKVWEQVEDHRREEGYVNGEHTVIKELGPYPIGWSTEPPVPTAEELKHQKRMIIISALDAIDAKGARAARAVALALVNGDVAAGADVEKLAVLEEEAQALRAELAELQ